MLQIYKFRAWGSYYSRPCLDEFRSYTIQINCIYNFYSIIFWIYFSYDSRHSRKICFGRNPILYCCKFIKMFDLYNFLIQIAVFSSYVITSWIRNFAKKLGRESILSGLLLVIILCALVFLPIITIKKIFDHPENALKFDTFC